MADADELRMYCVWRTDITIPYPKALVQSGHAYLAACLQAGRDRVFQYLTHSQPKIVLRAKNLETLVRAHRECGWAALPHYLVVDEGRTVFSEPTTTCLGIGPCLRSELPKYIARLQLLTMPTPDPEMMFDTLKRLADPEDACHTGAGGPWQEMAQQIVFGRAIKAEEWYSDTPTYRRLSPDELLARLIIPR